MIAGGDPAAPAPGGSAHVRVIKTEEKGSDVNLASYLLLDSFRRNCQAAPVISNDFDLLEPRRIAQREFGLKVGIGCPHKRPSHVLQQESEFIRPIRVGALQASGSRRPPPTGTTPSRTPPAWSG